MRKVPFKILFLSRATEAAVSEAMRGVLRYAATHPNWSVQTLGYHTSNQSIMHFENWHPDGIIVTPEMSVPEKLLFDKGLKAVVFLHKPPPADCPVPTATVLCDNDAIGDLAARHLISKRLGCFAYIGSPGRERWSDQRGAAFRRTVLAQGHAFHEYRPPGNVTSWAEEEIRLREFLVGLPRPCGVFAAFDARAKHVIDIARSAELNIPKGLQVIGVDNEDLTCENTRPTLTSIDADFHNGGYLAARRLDALLRGRRFRNGTILFSPKGVVERDSTSDYSGTARSVAAAQTFIRLYGTKPITVNDIATASGISLRLLQMHFKSALGHGIAAELRQHRLEHACRLLERTNTPPSRIAEFCSLGNPVNAAALFRRTYGLTMTDWRKRKTAQ